MTYPNRWCPKGLREHLCQQQTYAPDDATRRELQRVINLMDHHRPVGNDGKHNDRHTPTCGCPRQDAQDLSGPSHNAETAPLTPPAGSVGDETPQEALGESQDTTERVESAGRIGWLRLRPTHRFRYLAREVEGGWSDWDYDDEPEWSHTDWPEAVFTPR